MKDIKKVSIIGMGGVGASFASKLAGVEGLEFKVVVDEERYERYRSSGFIINGRSFHFDYILPEEQVGPADLVIIAVKYHQLKKAIEQMDKHVGPDAIILSLLNGISSEKEIGRVYGMEKLLYGMVLGIDAIRQSNTISYASTAKIYFGEADNKVYSERVQRVKALFDKAGIAYEIPEEMLRTLWWKFLFNVGINQASAVLNAPYKVFLETKEAMELMTSAMQEVLLLAEKEGIDLKQSDIEYFVDLLGKLSPEGKTSMLQDIEAKRKTEVEMLSGTVCQMGRQHNIDTPVNRTLYNIISTLEKNYR